MRQENKRKIRSLWEHRILRRVRNYYSGLGSYLLYHRIGARQFQFDEFGPYSGLMVPQKKFAEQAAYFKEKFNVVSLAESITQLQRGDFRQNCLVITFDDGYKDNLLNALPILERFELPATIYITTGFVDRSADLWWFEQEFIVQHCTAFDFEWEDWSCRWNLQSPEEKSMAIQSLNDLFKGLDLLRQKSLMHRLRDQCKLIYSYDSEILTWDEVRELDRHPLITIAGHTHNHPVLSQLTEEDLQSEVMGSRKRLEEELGHPIKHFAYPFGSQAEVGSREFDLARSAAFDSAVTTTSGHIYAHHKNYLHALPRISINNDDGLEEVAWKLCGINSIVQHYGRRGQVVT